MSGVQIPIIEQTCIVATPGVRFHRERVRLIWCSLVVTMDLESRMSMWLSESINAKTYHLDVRQLVLFWSLDILLLSDMGHIAPIIAAIELGGRLG